MPAFKTVYSSPMRYDAMESLRRAKGIKGDFNGLKDYFNNYNYFDQNRYNKLQTDSVAHEAIGHAGNYPDKARFYEPIARREGKSVKEIVPIEEKFWPTYWKRGVSEFT
jgi:hypothetical protein